MLQHFGPAMGKKRLIKFVNSVDAYMRVRKRPRPIFVVLSSCLLMLA
jgi:hypothetical protein